MDYEKIIHTIVDPFLIKPEALMVREIPGNSDKDITLLIVAENEDTARLIGKKGSVATALREVVSVAGKSENIHIHLKFESFDEEK
ncbi:MAG TPA: RNA-binding protein [Firmicutes bacterium]|nr:RNA-binding protein [Bacillota bacterium]